VSPHCCSPARFDGAAPLLTTPLIALLNDVGARAVMERHLPDLVCTLLVAATTRRSLIDLARTAYIPAAVLRTVAQDFAVSEGNVATHGSAGR
jgi:hypothetical protein